ncbi:MAG: aminopeptidase N [Gammaproteobacteria bacterium]|jgi:aminopeptidase N
MITTKYRKNYKPSSHLIDAIDLTIDLHEKITHVTAKMYIRQNPVAEKTDILVLNGEKQKLKFVKIDDERLLQRQYEINEKSLTLKNLPEEFGLEIQSDIKPQENTELMGLYKSGNMFCTQCESEGFRKITYYLDRPDVLSSFTATIIADKKRYPMLLSNGNLIASEDIDENRHLAQWEDPFKKPSYLFAMVAGNLDCIEDSFITKSNRKITLRIFSEKGNQEKCKFAMQSVKKAMKWDEERFGREYDLDIFMIVAVSDFNSGAMENKGLNIFNAKCILADPLTATDEDYARIDEVVAHEYFHNWTGDRVTCRDWFQLSLKEGLTVFRDQSFSEEITSKAVMRIDEVQRLRTLQFPEDAGPLAHPVRPDSYIKIDNFYTMTVYEKGAEIIRMMKVILGKEKFRKGMDLYFERFDGQAVTCDDFVQAMQDASGIDLTQFKLWYSQAGTPGLYVTSEYNSSAKKYKLTVKQNIPDTPGQKNKLPMHIPLAVKISDQEKVLSITQDTQTFLFEDIDQQPVPSLLRDFSAPVKLHYDYSDEELGFLMAHDDDAFVHWEAGQIYAGKILLNAVSVLSSRGLIAGSGIVLPDIFVDAFKNILLNKNLDQALIARMLILPTEIYLGELMPIIKVDEIHAAREKMQRLLAEKFTEEFLRIYHENVDNKPYKYNAKDAARRSFKNICLHYLMKLQDDKINNLCMQQFSQTDNMTDRFAAFVALVNKDCKERAIAIEKFYQMYQGDALVIDKWFAVQSMSIIPGVLGEVKRLLQHKDFTLKNPNRARAVLTSFAMMNPVAFHDISGEGYKLLADQILKMDKLNPKVTARLVKPLVQWRKYDKQRQALMQIQLHRILAEKNLSKETYEIVSKGLL